MNPTDDKPRRERLPSPSESLIVEREGALGWLTFSRPERMNAVTLEMWQALPRLLALLDDDPEIRVIVLKGAGGKAFVAGADVSQFEKTRADAAAGAAYERANAEAFAAIAGTATPTVAMIEGYCIGGGLAIALCCDLRFAAEGASFAIPAARLGIGYAPEGVRRLLHVVGPSFAKEILFTARRFTHEEAQAMGLVNRVLPREELEAFTREICGQIAANAPLTLRAAKRTVDALAAQPEGYDRAALEALIEACFDSADYKEGRRAFMEKRAPIFRGE